MRYLSLNYYSHLNELIKVYDYVDVDEHAQLQLYNINELLHVV